MTLTIGARRVKEARPNPPSIPRGPLKTSDAVADQVGSRTSKGSPTANITTWTAMISTTTRTNATIAAPNVRRTASHNVPRTRPQEQGTVLKHCSQYHRLVAS